MAKKPKKVNIQIIGYEKDVMAEENSGNYRVDFHLSSQPPGNVWTDAFEDSYSNNSNPLQGNAKVEGSWIIVRDVNESINPQALLDAVVNEAVRWANIEYDRQISTVEQSKERAKQE